MQLIEVKRAGIGSELVFHCENTSCDGQMSSPSCPQISAGNVKINLVNRLAVFAIHCTGGDLAELRNRTFCGVMDLPPPVKKVLTAKSVRH